MTVRVFSLCRRENKDKIQGSKLKVHTFVFCCSAVRHYEPSSGRKVSRMSVTEGACETEKRKKAEVFRRFNVNPSGASRQLPLHKGAYDCACLFFLPQRKQGQKSGLQNQKRKENESRALSFSRLRRQLPLGGSL